MVSDLESKLMRHQFIIIADLEEQHRALSDEIVILRAEVSAPAAPPAAPPQETVPEDVPDEDVGEDEFSNEEFDTDLGATGSGNQEMKDDGAGGFLPADRMWPNCTRSMVK